MIKIKKPLRLTINAGQASRGKKDAPHLHEKKGSRRDAEKTEDNTLSNTVRKQSPLDMRKRGYEK